MKYWFAIGMCLVFTQIQAKTLYKCRSNGVAAYRTTPCIGGEEQSEVKKIRSKSEEQKVIEANSSGIDGLELGSISVKVEPVDSIGSQWFVCKVDATNKTDFPMDLFIKYKAVDREGFLIKEIYLKGKVGAHSTETLTDKSYFGNGEYAKVGKWVLVKD